MDREEGAPKLAAPSGPRLLDRVREAIQRRHYSHRTEETYVHWIRRFIYFSGKRHPAVLGADEVTAFLNHLAGERNVAAATQNQALSALACSTAPACACANAWACASRMSISVIGRSS